MKRIITTVFALALVSSVFAQHSFRVIKNWGHFDEYQQRFNDGVETIDFDKKTGLLVWSFKSIVGVGNINDPLNPYKVRDIQSNHGSIRCVAAHEGVVAVVTSNYIELWDIYSGIFIAEYPLGDEPDNVQFSPDGKYMVVSNEGDADGSDGLGSVSIFDMTGGWKNLVETRVGFAPYTINAFNFNGFDSRTYDYVPNWNFTAGPFTMFDSTQSWRAGYEWAYLAKTWTGPVYAKNDDNTIYWYDRNDRWANNGTAYAYESDGNSNYLFKNVCDPNLNPSNVGVYADMSPIATEGKEYVVRFQYAHGYLTDKDSFGYIVEFDNGTTWDKTKYVNLVDINENMNTTSTSNTQRMVTANIPSTASHFRLRVYARFEAGGDSSKFAFFDEVRSEADVKEVHPSLYIPTPYNSTSSGKLNKGDDAIEPEYVAITDDSKWAFVTLQENNAIAKINLETKKLDTIFSCGFVDYDKPGYEVFLGDDFGGAKTIINYPISAMKMPDGIKSFVHEGKTYLITVNEGEDGGMINRDDLKDVTDPDGLKGWDSAALHFDTRMHLWESDFYAGDFKRYLVDRKLTDTNGDSLVDRLIAVGSRNFTIYDEDGNIVHEGETFDHHQPWTDDTRALGHEPEGVTVGIIEGHRYAFMVLERGNSIMIYNIDDPFNPVYVQHLLVGTRPEYVVFIDAEHSPTGEPIIVTANENDQMGITIIGISKDIANNSKILTPNGLTGMCKVMGAKDQFWVTTGRGPVEIVDYDAIDNREFLPTNQGQFARDSSIFHDPTFEPRVYKVKRIANSENFEIIDSVFINYMGTNMNGLPSTVPGNPTYTGETPLNNSKNGIAGSEHGIYPGDVVVGPQGLLYIGDKYAARIFVVNSKTGEVTKVYTPWGNNPNLDTMFKYARPLMGIGALATNPDGLVYAMTEFPLDVHLNGTDYTKARTKGWRLIEINAETEAVIYYGINGDDRWKITGIKWADESNLIAMYTEHDNLYEESIQFVRYVRPDNTCALYPANNIDWESTFDRNHCAVWEGYETSSADRAPYGRSLLHYPYMDFEGFELLSEASIVILNNNNFGIAQFDYRDATQAEKVPSVFKPYNIPSSWTNNIVEFFDGASIKVDYDFNKTNIINENDGLQVEFRVDVNNPRNEAGSATISVIETDGITADDYTFAPATFNFPAMKDTTFIFTIDIKDDNVKEKVEELRFEVTNVTVETYKVGFAGKSNHFKVISNEGNPTIGFDKSFIEVDEEAGSVSLNVILNGLSTEDNEVKISVIGGDAVAGKDFNLLSTTFNYPAETQGSKPINLSIVGNTDVDGDRTVVLSIEVTNGDATIDVKTVSVTIRDNDLKTSIRAALGDHDIALYPNPAVSQTRIVSNREMQSVKVTDMQGKVIYVQANAGFEHYINVENLTSGVYLVHVTTTKGTFVTKLQVN